ncbi:hypothetical protein [Specibacter sp. NPDC078692]|uniref:hypothetical protein n=1 Tax=Specibacter sp. NPDC078692 TaxID=3155818 RepID=UPI003447680A
MIQELENLSLIDGPLPLMVLCLGVASLLFLLFRRSLRWWIFVIVSALLAFAVSSAACWAVIHVLYVWPEDLPTPVVISVALVLWLLTLGSTTALAGLRRQRRGVVAGLAMWRLGTLKFATLPGLHSRAHRTPIPGPAAAPHLSGVPSLCLPLWWH